MNVDQKSYREQSIIEDNDNANQDYDQEIKEAREILEKQTA